MKSFRHRWTATAAVAVIGLASFTAAEQPAHAAVPDLGQQVAVPAYIPTSDSASWGSLTTASSQLGFIVVNVANGPDTVLNPEWQTKINLAHANGIKVLGYVDSGYFGGSVPVRTTVLGETDATSWMVQAQQDINRWYGFYGNAIDGIFIDDGMNTCGPTAGSNAYADLYEELDNYTHSTHPGALTVLNPGITVPQCYEDTADILVTYEGPMANYLAPPAALAPAQWQLDGDPNKFWEIIYDVDAASLDAVSDRSKSNNAGYVYATPDGLPNPYDTAPTGSYWAAELAGTLATTPSLPARPTTPTAADVYSTGVDLTWTSSTSSSIVGYDVYRTSGGTSLKIGSVGNYTPDLTEFTVVGLSPSTAYGFAIKARSISGATSTLSNTRQVTTDSAWGSAPTAPAALTATNVTANGVRLTWQASTSSDDTVEAYDVYVNGVRELILNGSTTSIRLGYLSPGTSYAFSVVARASSNTPSAVSNTASVLTPSPTPLANPSVTFGATTARFQAQYNLSFNFQNVFIDTDNNAATGYAISGLGAEFLLQGGSYFAHVPGTNGWNWSTIALPGSPLVSNANGLYVWEVPSSTLGSTTTLRVIFNGSGSSPDATTATITAVKQ